MKKRKIGWVAATTIALLIFAIGLPHVPPVRRFALTRLSAYLRQSQGIVLEARSLDYNLLSLRFWLEGLSLRDDKATGFPPFLTAERIQLHLSFSALVHGALAARRLEVDGLRLQVATRQDGSSNLPRNLGNTTGDSKLRLPAESLDVTNLSVSIDDERAGLSLQFPAASLSGRTGERPDSQELRWALQHAGTIEWGGRKLPIERLGLDIRLQSESVILQSLELESAGSRIHASGRLQDIKSPRFQAATQADIQSTPLAAWLGIQEPVEGRLDASLQIAGNAEHSVVEGELRSAQFTIAGVKMESLAAAGRFEPSTGILELRNLSSEIYSGQVRATGQLALGGKGQSNIVCRANGLNLRQISREPAWRTLPPASLSARFTANFPGLQWDNSQLNANTTLTVGPGHGAGKVSTIEGVFDVQVRGQKVDIAVKSIAGPGTNLQGSVALGMSDRSLSGEITGNIDSLSRLIQGIELGMNKPAGSLVPIPLDGAARWHANLSGTVPQPVAAVELEASDLSSGSVSNAGFSLQGKYAEQRFVVERSSLHWHGQTGAVTGEIGFGSDSVPFHLAAAFDAVAIDEVLKGLALSPVVGGSASATISAEGTAKDPRARIQFKVQDAEAYGERLGLLTGEADWSGRTLSLRKLELDKPQEGGNGKVEATGSIKLDSREYEFSLSGANLRSEKLRLPGDVPVTGVFSFGARGTGSLDNPAAQLEAEFKDLKVADEEVGQLRAELHLANHQANLKVADLIKGITATSEITMAAPYPVRFDVVAPRYSRAILKGGARVAEITSAAVVKGEGSLSPMEISNASAQLTGFQIEVGEEKIRSEAPIEIRFADRRFQLPPATLASGRIRIQAGGDMPLAGGSDSGDISLKGEIDLDALPALLHAGQTLDTRGKVTLQGEVRGNWQDLQPSVTATLTGGYLHSNVFPGALEEIRADVKLNNWRISIDQLTAKAGEGTVQASADFPLSFIARSPQPTPTAPGPPARFSIQAGKLPLSALIPLPENAVGQFSARLTGEADAPAVDRVTARLELTETLIRRDPFVIQAEVMTASIKDGLLQIDPWRWTTPRGEMAVKGTVGLTGDFPLDLHLSGNVDAGICSLFSPSVVGGGVLRLDLSAQGTARDPLFSGLLEMDKGSIGLRQPKLLIEDLGLKVAIAQNGLTIEKMSGVLNGSRFQGSGNTSLRKGKVENVEIDLVGNDVFLEYPKGMKSASNAKLQIRSKDEAIVIGGEIAIREGSYREAFDFSALGGGTGKGVEQDESGGKLEVLGSPVRFDVKIRTRQPVEIDNNLAKLSATADVRLVGDAGHPGLLGAVTLERAGKIYFGGRVYYVERGVVSFTDEASVNPVFDLLATTQVSEYQVSLRLSGTGSDVTTTFTSEPPLSQTDVVALLLTGKPTSESTGSRVDPAQAEKMSLVTSALNADLSARARRTFGISQVMIQPSLISSESDPGARLTVGQDLSQSLRLVYSTNLADSTDQVWYAEYDVRRSFKTRAVKQSDNTYRGDFEHDIRFGGRRPGATPLSSPGSAKLTVGRVEFGGNPVFKTNQLADKFKIRPGNKFDFVKSRKGVERLQKFYAKQDYLAARIQMNRDDRDQQVDLNLQIEAGRRVKIEISGAKVPKSLRKQVRSAWQEGVSDRQRSQDAEERLHAYFATRGFLQTEVATKASEVPPDELRVIFEVQPGVRYERVEIVFDGASPENAASMATRIRHRKLTEDVYVRPNNVVDDLTSYYRQRGYLRAKVDLPRPELNEEHKTAKIIFPVSEGQPVHVATVGFTGNEALPTSLLKSKLPLKEGSVLEPDLLKKSGAAIVEQYGRNGYRKAVIRQSVKLDEKQALAEVTFTINEGIKSVIQSLKVEGEDRISEKYIREQLRIAEGEPLNVPETNRSIRNLYNTGGFSQVDIESEPHKEAAAENKQTEKVDVVVKVQEIAPYKFLYGGYYDTARGPGVIATIENRNSLGNARVLGLRGRYDRDLQEGRLYFSQPLFRQHPLPTTATLFYRRETDYYEGLSAERFGFTLQQEATIKKRFIISYGYRLENVRSWYPDRRAPDPPRATVAPITVSLSRNTRDDFLDPTRGSFTSVAMEYAPGLWSSRYGYVRNFTQYFKYFPLFKPGYAPFQEDTKRPRTIYATGVRLGLMKGFKDNFVIPTERFYAGGGTSVRGFGQDQLGPLDSSGDPLGGNAMFVLNNELRFPMVSILDGVGFVDIGNVFPEVSDFRFSDLRKTAGFGLRLRTPSLMLRFDYGFKLDRRPGESLGAFFFSIGQAY